MFDASQNQVSKTISIESMNRIPMVLGKLGSFVKLITFIE